MWQKTQRRPKEDRASAKVLNSEGPLEAQLHRYSVKQASLTNSYEEHTRAMANTWWKL